MEWYKEALRKYAVFSGRASRKEFWMFTLINFLISLAFSILSYFAEIFAYAAWIYSVAIFIPMLAVSIRRLHDIGRTGWWYLVAFIPLIGTLWVLYLFIKRGDYGPNKYGPPPASEPNAFATV